MTLRVSLRLASTLLPKRAVAHIGPILRNAAKSRPWPPTALRRRISRVLGVDPKSLRKCYREELDLGQTKANAQVAGFLFSAAKSGNVAAQIFWLKTRARWHEVPTAAFRINQNSRR